MDTDRAAPDLLAIEHEVVRLGQGAAGIALEPRQVLDRKSTRLNSSHSQISYAVFCLKKKKHTTHAQHCPPRSPPRTSPTPPHVPPPSSPQAYPQAPTVTASAPLRLLCMSAHSPSHVL